MSPRPSWHRRPACRNVSRIGRFAPTPLQSRAITTALTGHYAIPDYDKAILSNMLSAEVDLRVIQKEKFLVGLRNAKQEIYRVIGASTEKQYNNAVEELEDRQLGPAVWWLG